MATLVSVESNSGYAVEVVISDNGHTLLAALDDDALWCDYDTTEPLSAELNDTINQLLNDAGYPES